MTGTDREREILEFIRMEYGPIIEREAERWFHRPEVLAGIMMRESEGGTSRYLDRPGPEGRGDKGHGHGLMQIDDRSFPSFCAGDNWKDPAHNIYMGASILAGKRVYIVTKLAGLNLGAGELERASIAAYNCGEGNVRKSLLAGGDVDERTAHGNYSEVVLHYAERYRSIVEGRPYE